MRFRPLSGMDATSASGIVGTPAAGATNGNVRIADNIDGSSSVAGNARGAGAVDLQIARSVSSQVASGLGSVIGGGFANKASGAGAVVAGGQGAVASGDNSTVSGGTANDATGEFATVGGGFSNTASGHGSAIVGGRYALAPLHGQEAFAAATFDGSEGSCQRLSLIANSATTDSTPGNVFLDGGSERILIADGYAWAFTASVFGIDSTGAKAGHYIRKGMIANVGGTTALIGSITTVGTDTETDAGLDVTITADNTNDALDIQVTGLAATDMRWIAHVEGLQLKYTT